MASGTVLVCMGPCNTMYHTVPGVNQLQILQGPHLPPGHHRWCHCVGGAHLSHQGESCPHPSMYSNPRTDDITWYAQRPNDQCPLPGHALCCLALPWVSYIRLSCDAVCLEHGWVGRHTGDSCCCRVGMPCLVLPTHSSSTKRYGTGFTPARPHIAKHVAKHKPIPAFQQRSCEPATFLGWIPWHVRR